MGLKMFRKNFSKIKELADNFQHCGDYGHFFIHNEKDKIFIVLGDCDDIYGEQIEEFTKLGYEVEYEAEYFPDDKTPWTEFSRGSIPTKWNEDYEPIEWEKCSCEINEIKFDEEAALKKFNAWLSEPYGKYSSRDEYISNEEKSWAWAAFKAALE
jgi:hypothetical protein